MRYLGGKQRIGRQLADVINTIGTVSGAETYCEPFCGMCGVGRAVTIPRRVFSDASEDLILLLLALRDGWEPPTTLTRDEYKALRHSEPSALRGFAGFGCSFGGKWFGGYASDRQGTNYALNGSRSGVKLGLDLRGSTITRHSYLDAPKADITYCDPPYAGTTSYGAVGPWDVDAFWEWVRHRGGLIFVSEYKGPDWAEVIWSKTVKCTISKSAKSGSAHNDRVEKLFFVDNS